MHGFECREAIAITRFITWDDGRPDYRVITSSPAPSKILIMCALKAWQPSRQWIYTSPSKSVSATDGVLEQCLQRKVEKMQLSLDQSQSTHNSEYAKSHEEKDICVSRFYDGLGARLAVFTASRDRKRWCRI